ncbi:MAG: ATP-binding protein [Gemmatimonadaceae bacterium]
MPRAPSREVAIVDSAQCDACGLCLPLCPPGAIHLRRSGLLIDDAVCTGCHKCIAPCPVGALAMVGREEMNEREMGNGKGETVSSPHFPFPVSRFPPQ